MPLQMQPNTWRCKSDAHRCPWLGIAFGLLLCTLTMGPTRDAGCWKKRKSVWGGNPLYSFLIIKGDTLRETASFFLHRPKHVAVRKDKDNAAFQ